MLTRLLSKKARREEGGRPAEAQLPTAPTLARDDSLLLFVPMDGGMSFRLFAVDDEAAAAAFLGQEFPGLGGKPLLFRPLRAGMRPMDGEQVEVLVVINDPSRPGTVYVSSFTDMESAESFVKFETRDGQLDPRLVTVHRGVPQLIDAGPAMGPYSIPVPTRPANAAPVVPPTHFAAAAAAAPGMGTVAVPRAPQPAMPPTVKPAVTGESVSAKTRAQAKAAPQQAAEGEQRGLMSSINAWPGWDTLRARIEGSLRMNWETYEEMRKDPIAGSQARVLVAAGAAAAGIGAFWAGPLGLILYLVCGLLGWLACAYLTHWVGTVFFPGRQSPENKELLFKTLAFAHAPRLLLVIGLVVGAFLPLMPLIVLGVLLWSLVAMVPATEYSLEIDRQSATLTALTSWLALFAISFVLPSLLV